MKKLSLPLALFLGLAPSLWAQWDPTKPPQGPSAPKSEDLRNNWNALAQSVGTTNLMADPTFLIWAAGDTSAPTHYTLAGAGASIARAGTGLGDTNRKVGDFCAKVASAAATTTLSQDLLPTAAFTKASYLQGQTVSGGAWVRTSSASAVRVCYDDGIGTSCSAFHAGGSVWSWLTVSRTISGTATKLAFYLEVASGTITAYYSGPTAILGPVVPQYSQPAPISRVNLFGQVMGTVTTGTNKSVWLMDRPTLIQDVELMAITGPTGQALIVDVNTYDGANPTSMFSTRPQIAAGATIGGAQPDSTYARRCTSALAPSAVAGFYVSLDVDQVGSGVAGSDLFYSVRGFQYARPLEAFLAYNDIR